MLTTEFKVMPWKNGGGVTTELYRIPSTQSDSFLFRLSMASVQSDGLFSIFPGIDRILLLLEGKGFHLKGPIVNHSMVNQIPFSFKGEEEINCTLIEGSCLDFNVMTDRSFAKSTLSLESSISHKRFTAESDLKFIYDKDNKKLYKLELGDALDFNSESPTSLLVIDVTYL